MQNKRNRHGRQGHNVTGEPLDSIHLGEGERIRLDEIPIEDSNGDNQVGNRAYNDARYQFKGQSVNNQTAFLSGGFWVYTGTGLIFQTVRTVFIMAGYDNPFVVESVLINLEDFPELDNTTFPQYVRPIFDINGNAFPLFGLASADPGVPSVADPLTQIAGDEFLLNAGATTVDPGDGEGQVQTVVLFAEGSVGEATWVHTGSGSTNFANAAAPIAGLIDANVSNVQNNSRQIGTRADNFNPTDFETISLDLKLKAIMLTGYNLAIQFWDAANTPVSSLVNLPIDKNSTATQKVGLAISDFTFTAGLARKVVLQWRRGSGAVTYVGFNFDNFILQGGTSTPIVQGDVVLQGQAQGSGKTGTPINVTLTPLAVSAQPNSGTLLGSEEIILRDPITNQLRKTTLSSALGLANGNSGRRLVSSQILIDSPTAGRINAQWYNAANVLRTLTNAALTFAGATTAGNLRWDLVELYDDGTAAVKTGTQGVTAVRPAPTANTLIAGEFIWDENGIATPVENIGSFSNDRYATLISANTTGLYAKIWEGDLSASNNYGIDIAYHEPTNPVNEDGTGIGNMKVSWTCDTAKNIDTGTVKFITYPGSLDGEFRLVQLAGNKAALYHRSNHYWGRIQFRILFQNSAVRIQDFINLGPYGAEPTGVGFWDSEVLQDEGVTGSGTTNEIAYFTAPKSIASLPVATYPSLAEIAHVKGVTSPIQPQLNAKNAALGTDINAALGAAASPTALNAFVTVSALNSYAYVQEAPINGNTYARKDGVWTAFTPFVVAGTATDGHVVTSVAGVPTWQAPAGGGGGSKWTDVGSGIYRNSAVAIGRTTIPTNNTFSVQSLSSTAAHQFFQVLNNSASSLFYIRQDGESWFNSPLVRIGNPTTGIAAQGFHVKSAGSLSSDITFRCQNASNINQFTIFGDGGIAQGPDLRVGTTTSSIGGRGPTFVGTVNNSNSIFRVLNSSAQINLDINGDGTTIIRSHLLRVGAPTAVIAQGPTFKSSGNNSNQLAMRWLNSDEKVIFQQFSHGAGVQFNNPSYDTGFHYKAANTDTTKIFTIENSSNSIAIEIRGNRQILLAGVRAQTTDPLIADALWNDGGTIKISAG